MVNAVCVCQASNCRTRFGYLGIYFLRMAWNCTQLLAAEGKIAPEAPNMLSSAGYPSADMHQVPDMEVMLAVPCPRTWWPPVFSRCLQRAWPALFRWLCCWLRDGLKPLGTLRLTHSPAFHCVCDTWAYAQVCLLVHSWCWIACPSTGRKFNYSTLASNAITLNRRGTFPLLNSSVCSASLSRGKQVYKSATSLF